jgi:hypothetical protein
VDGSNVLSSPNCITEPTATSPAVDPPGRNDATCTHAASPPANPPAADVSLASLVVVEGVVEEAGIVEVQEPGVAGAEEDDEDEDEGDDAGTQVIVTPTLEGFVEVTPVPRLVDVPTDNVPDVAMVDEGVEYVTELTTKPTDAHTCAGVWVVGLDAGAETVEVTGARLVVGAPPGAAPPLTAFNSFESKTRSITFLKRVK